MRRHTNGGGARIDAVFNELFADRLQINNDLARLDVVDGAALYGLDCGHINPCRGWWTLETWLTTRRVLGAGQDAPALACVGCGLHLFQGGGPVSIDYTCLTSTWIFFLVCAYLAFALLIFRAYTMEAPSDLGQLQAPLRHLAAQAQKKRDE